MDRRVVKTYYNYRVELYPSHDGIITIDGKLKKINSTSFEFASEHPLTYKQVEQKIEGTKNILTIEGIFRVL